MKTMFRFPPIPTAAACALATIALGAFALILEGRTARAQAQRQVQGGIITWGANTREWNRALGLDAFRIGCSSAPDSCVRTANRLAGQHGIERVFLSIVLDGRSAANARAYSELSLRNPLLYEVGFDDFVSQAQRQREPFPDLSLRLRDIARRLKSANPDLKFGLTIYMDNVSSSRFPLDRLDAEFRRNVDYVHLYPHYRREKESFSSVVRKIEGIFPNTRVIGGVYAYDRRDYLPCALGNSARCSNEEELSLFEDQLRERWDMFRSGRISWIEFYPAAFGLEEQWSGWKQPRSCRAGRLSECVSNTRAMRRIVREVVTTQRDSRTAASDRGN
jgi:hypothetical protein